MHLMNYRATYFVLADVGLVIFFFRIPISLLLFPNGNDHLLVIWVYQSSGSTNITLLEKIVNMCAL